ncbi:mycofactocin dehydrogenase MftG [Rhodococcus tibetensis]|uniref:Mycofactocin system GMC family oxidoreductase MftG n=1 Tax=Rhodococcus tibetensis TaxID=2965064 RepID=A0ABT1QBT8_9NOCA|nr:mycofactocin system GMC family oxidoreductase MftG [Rhodococcus sp. FXJ9.536]MCQ4119733.1 mycofactocin system GMC family oxidoreductase MftG [Rhodococcus sp. FXJ9.536]
MAGPVRAADVVVVGGGSSGCVVAARLSENPDRSVVLLESGSGYRSADDCPPVLDYRTLPVGPRSPYGAAYRIELAPGMPSVMVRGHVLGGSGAVNGAYFIRGTATDFDQWPPSWSYGHVLPYFRALETDADFEGPSHGATGPVPVRRQPADRLSAVSAAFHRVALDAGFPEEADKNGGGGGGIGPVPLNVGGGRRVSTATAYLLPALNRPNLTVEANAHVVRILLSGNKVVGVEVESAGARRVLRADRVVLAAGAVETPVLLMHSGIGPADHLRDNGIRPVINAPGVGSDFSDHPEVALPYHARDELRRDATSPVVETVLNVGRIEIRPYTASFDVLVPGSGQPVPRLGIGLMVAESRGRLRLTSPHRRDNPRIEYRYAQTGSDRRALRDGVCLGVELLRSPALRFLVEPSSDEVSDESVLAHLGTSLHLCGSCRMGNSEDPGAVVDERCNVRGVDGLTIADTSVFPAVPSRGPHATAVMVAERVSTFLSG